MMCVAKLKLTIKSNALSFIAISTRSDCMLIYLLIDCGENL